MNPRRDYRGNRAALFDGIEEGGIRAASSYSSHEIDEHDNDNAHDGLQDRVSILKREHKWLQSKPKIHEFKEMPSPATTKQHVGMSKEMSLNPNKSETFPDAIPSNNALESTSDTRKGDVAVDVEFEFEARSRKDGAWYDVASFLTHRVHSSGEYEVLVRYVGYGAEEDEWVNVKNAVRERSLPLEPSECCNVKVGDLVLCFQDGRDQAMYYDAHVKEIRQRLHDIRGCRCLFLVHYDHDHTEEQVLLSRLCRRPSP
ncbi:Bet1-like SNARE 1-1 [Acorus calamus]|uniref:Bet1-like SNARE 1-1 n=1 Tax=Acorus calamus TaxID=4465 RepID=A0AAV9CKW2_ACOCL|nr:Bet1-like SNARE 1-1 [Acorus calamus]